MMRRSIFALFCTFILCGDAFVKKFVNFTHRAIYSSKISLPNDTKWDDGEIPWEFINDDNTTSVRPLPPKDPFPPLSFQEQRLSNHRIICAIIE